MCVCVYTLPVTPLKLLSSLASLAHLLPTCDPQGCIHNQEMGVA